MRSGDRLARWMTGAVIVAGAAGAILVFAGIQTPARVPLALLLLAAAPALAVASLLGGIGSFAKMVVAGSAAIVIDILVAEAMVISGTWSPRTGLAAVVLLSILIAASRPLAARRSEPPAAPAPWPASGGPRR